eukprot:1682307-Rhodomonas_salina.1
MPQSLALPQHPRQTSQTLVCKQVPLQIKISQRRAPPQHPCQIVCSLVFDIAVAQVEMSQPLALAENLHQPTRSLLAIAVAPP